MLPFPKPNLLLQQWFGVSFPVWAAALTVRQSGTLGRCTDPILCP